MQGIVQAWMRKAVVPLLCVLAVASFWSTAMVEIAGIVLVLFLFSMTNMRRSVSISATTRPRFPNGGKFLKRVLPAAAASLCLLVGCGTGQQYAALPEGLDRTAVPHVVITVQALRYEFIPDTIRVQSGTLVTLKISSTAGTHGFSLGAFGIDERIEEGQTRLIEFYAPRAGEFDFHCSHFCGIGHFWMSGKVIVQ